MSRIDFTKMVASGNDFVVVVPPARPAALPFTKIARKVCDRRWGVGADGLLVLEKSKVAAVRMRIFNADGSEAQMCGNGARCAALYLKIKSQKSKVKITTRAGIIESRVSGGHVQIKLPDPKDIRLDIPLKVKSRTIRANFINTGVPHAVIFVDGLKKIAVFDLGREIRAHTLFKPAGTNVDFLEIINKNSIKIRTYERGVEDETLACGTGAAASALIFSLKANVRGKINVHTQGREVLTVHFKNTGSGFQAVWLGGRARIAFRGQFNY